MPANGSQIHKFMNAWMFRSAGTWWVLLSFLILLAAPWLFEHTASNAYQNHFERSALKIAQSFSSRLETAQSQYLRTATTTGDAVQSFDTISSGWLAKSDSIVAVQLVDASGITLRERHRSSARQLPVSRIALAYAFELQAPHYSAPTRIHENLIIDWIVPVNAPNPMAFVLTFDTAMWSSDLNEKDSEFSFEVVPFIESELQVARNNYIVNQPSWEGLWSLKFQSKDPLVSFLTTIRPFFMVLIFLLIFVLFYGHWRNFHRQETAKQEKAERSKYLEKHNTLTMLGQISASLAHEINQPLSTIANYAAAGQIHLKQTDPSSDLLPFFQKIQSQSERAGNVLKAVRAIIHTTPVEGSVLEISSLVDGLEPHLRSMCFEHKVTLHIQKKSNIWIYMNGILFEQVLINLVKNSIQALQTSQIATKSIWLDLKTEKTRLLIEVRDNGPGIPPAHLSDIFTSFFTTKTDGLGVGLNLCRSVAERFNGQLSLKSNSAEGVCFLLDFPLLGAPPLTNQP